MNMTVTSQIQGVRNKVCITTGKLKNTTTVWTLTSYSNLGGMHKDHRYKHRLQAEYLYPHLWGKIRDMEKDKNAIKIKFHDSMFR